MAEQTLEVGSIDIKAVKAKLTTIGLVTTGTHDDIVARLKVGLGNMKLDDLKTIAPEGIPKKLNKPQLIDAIVASPAPLKPAVPAVQATPVAAPAAVPAAIPAASAQATHAGQEAPSVPTQPKRATRTGAKKDVSELSAKLAQWVETFRELAVDKANPAAKIELQRALLIATGIVLAE